MPLNHRTPKKGPKDPRLRQCRQSSQDVLRRAACVEIRARVRIAASDGTCFAPGGNRNAKPLGVVSAHMGGCIKAYLQELLVKQTP